MSRFVLDQRRLRFRAHGLGDRTPGAEATTTWWMSRARQLTWKQLRGLPMRRIWFRSGTEEGLRVWVAARRILEMLCLANLDDFHEVHHRDRGRQDVSDEHPRSERGERILKDNLKFLPESTHGPRVLVESSIPTLDLSKSAAT